MISPHPPPFPSLKPHFSRALAHPRLKLHLAAHSHHLWPDPSFAGQTAAWEDAARLWDTKWAHVFNEIIPTAQRHIARRLNLPDPSTIAFAPNTHDFVRRLLSALPSGRAPRILTSDGEFHSLTRQLARLEEDRLVQVTRVPVRPFADFAARFAEAARGAFDLVFVSQVFFNSGWVIEDLPALVAAVAREDTLVAIDGYHGFMARPTDLAPIAHRAFYIAGGYKYAMSGEGVCFMHCPPGIVPRPRDTGWYAGFGTLSGAHAEEVGYGTDGSRFLGATFDVTGLYRMNAVMNWLDGLGIEVADIHARSVALQDVFAAAMDRAGIPGLSSADLLVPLDRPERGNFLAYDSAHAPAIRQRLLDAGIYTDVRGSVLRVGFGLYHDMEDIEPIAAQIRAAIG
jgi:selenocysteine lyase/cysteine desulfurase